MYDMDALTIRIPKELRDELNRCCDQEHRSASEVVRESIREYITIHEFRRIRQTLMPYARAKGFVTDEDVFEAIS